MFSLSFVFGEKQILDEEMCRFYLGRDGPKL